MKVCASFPSLYAAGQNDPSYMEDNGVLSCMNELQ